MAPAFENRRHAGKVLAQELYKKRYDSKDVPVLVLALPRGGVPVAFEVALALHAPLDVFVVRKLGVPSHPELAMGALASGGIRVVNEAVVQRLGIPNEVVEEVTRSEMDQMSRRELQYRGELPAAEPSGAHVILVDDGLATGATMRAAAEAVRRREPARITVAVPTAPSETARRLRTVADEVVCTIEADNFVAVGQWYEDFSQTTDEEVRALLIEARTRSDDRLLH